MILVRLKRKYGANLNSYNLLLTHEGIDGAEVRANQLFELPVVCLACPLWKRNEC